MSFPEPRTPKQKILAYRFQAAKAEAAGDAAEAARLYGLARDVEITEAQRVHDRRAAAKIRYAGSIVR
jgi:hypothetical protein